MEKKWNSFCIQMVNNRWGAGNHVFHQYFSQRGFIIFSFDNRGTGGRGKAFKDMAYGDYGKYIVKDHIEAAKYLQSLPYVCLLYTSPSPRDLSTSRMPSSA